MDKDIARLITVLKSGKKPAQALLQKVQYRLSTQLYNKVTKFIAGDKRVSLSKLVDQLKQTMKTIHKGGVDEVDITGVGNNWRFDQANSEGYEVYSPGQQIQIYSPSTLRISAPVPVSFTIDFMGKQYVVPQDKLLGEGTYARVFEMGDEYAVKQYKDQNNAPTLHNIQNIKQYLKPLASKGVYTSFVDVGEDILNVDGHSYLVLQKMEGSLDDAFGVFIDISLFEANWIWVCDCINTVTDMMNISGGEIYDAKQSTMSNGLINYTQGLIHGDIKLANVLWKGDSVYLHDFDVSLLIENPIANTSHSLTVGCTHPLYYVLKDLYYPKLTTSTLTVNERTYLDGVWSGYMSIAKFTPSLITAHRYLYAYLLNVVSLNESNVIEVFAKVAQDKDADVSGYKLDGIVLTRYGNSHAWKSHLLRWLHHFDKFALHMSVFIKVTALYGSYYNDKVIKQIIAAASTHEEYASMENSKKIETITTKIEEAKDILLLKCQKALQNVKDIISAVDDPALQQGGSRRKKPNKVKKMAGGGGLPHRSTLKGITEFDRIMSPDNLMLNSIITRVVEVESNASTSLSANLTNLSSSLRGSTAPLRLQEYNDGLPVNSSQLQKYDIRVGAPNNSLKETY